MQKFRELLIAAKEKYKQETTVKTFLGYNTKVLGEIKYNFKNKTITCLTCCLYSEGKGWVEIVE